MPRTRPSPGFARSERRKRDRRRNRRTLRSYDCLSRFRSHLDSICHIYFGLRLVLHRLSFSQFRSRTPHHAVAARVFYQRPPDLASGIVSEDLAKKADSFQAPAVDRSLPHAESASGQPSDHTSSSSVPERPSLPPMRQSNPAIGHPNGAAPGSSSGGGTVAKGGGDTQGSGADKGSGAGKGSGSGSSMKKEKYPSGKSGQGSKESNMATAKHPNQATSRPTNNSYAREALQASRSNLANQRSQRAIASQMRTLSGGQRGMSGVRGSRGGGHHR